MKHIKKTATPDFFIKHTKNLKSWNRYHSPKKRKLKQHILEKEQFGLCCYCERKVRFDNDGSHIEHIKPKHLDAANLTFDYSNLLVSCAGVLQEIAQNIIDDNEKEYICGHKKDKSFNEQLFLNPTTVTDISSYFAFDYDTGKISASPKDVTKANYMIELLNLNGRNNRLAEARKNKLKDWIEEFGKFNFAANAIQQAIADLLADDSATFITFLRAVL